MSDTPKSPAPDATPPDTAPADTTPADAPGSQAAPDEDRAAAHPGAKETGAGPRPKSHGRLKISATLTPRALMDDRPALAGAWEARIITLFPGAFPGVLGESLTGKALAEGLWRLETVDLRGFGIGKHRNVDDTPTGGGAGMVLRADVLAAAIDAASAGLPRDRGRWPLVYLSPRGRRFDQAMARRFAAADGVTFICGRFEGVDERVIEDYAIEEVSLGDFVMTGGEIAAQAMIDAAVRLRPGVLGNAASTEEESFSHGLLEHPQYTRPPEWRGRSVPAVLLSGHHGEIARWRRAEAERITRERRPDLWQRHRMDADRAGKDRADKDRADENRANENGAERDGEG